MSNIPKGKLRTKLADNFVINNGHKISNSQFSADKTIKKILFILRSKHLVRAFNFNTGQNDRLCISVGVQPYIM